MRWLEVNGEEEACPEQKVQRAGDEYGYWCELMGHPCSREYEDIECDEYLSIIKDWREESNG